MKKEFITPIVDARELSVLNSIMDGPMLISGEQSHASLKLIEIKVDDTNAEYSMWKSKQEQ